MDRLKRMYWGIAAGWFAMGIAVSWWLDRSPATIALVMVGCSVAGWFIKQEEARR